MKKIRIPLYGTIVLLFIATGAFGSYMGFEDIAISGNTGTLDGTGDFLGIEISFLATGGDLTFDDDGDLGVGVTDDEITGGIDTPTDGVVLSTDPQSIAISFSQTIYMETFTVVDLFDLDQGAGGFEQGSYFYTLGGYLSGTTIFGSDANDDFGGEGPEEGQLVLGIDQFLDTITFVGVNQIVGADFNHDYALQGFDGSAAVPEPATVLLLGFGLAGLAGVRKFKHKEV